MDFNVNIPVRVISGKACVKNSSALLAGLGKKCIIVTGGSSAKKSGALTDVTQALEKENTEYIIYDKIGPNPRLDHCHEAGKIAREYGAGFVIGIGGGSPLDAAKAVAVYAANPHFSKTDIYLYAQNERNRALPIVCVGTTAGTGSEVGRVSVLTNPETGRKKSIAPDDCNPSLTLADPTYTHSMPYDITVSTALDALAHVLEGYMSVKCGDIPTLFGEKAIALIWEGLMYLHKEKNVPDEALREKLYYGSLYAGITLAYCGTAFPHPLGYILTENYNIPHGKACTAFMSEFISRSMEHEKEKTAKVLNIMSTDLESFKKVIEELTDLPVITMTKDEIEKYCERFDTVPNNFRFSPGGFTKEEAVKVFERKFLK
ncbi:MAG: iron-containing alcohol dehydrogenase [Clostridia bacterium]|nr:iron-containing alcohol dehydrogenase [Clostridia bacterium]